jgi:hypothetical protein
VADEIKLTVSLTLANGSLADSFAPGEQKITQTTKRMHKRVQAIPTTAAGTALDIGAVVTLGYGYARNLDANNYIEIGVQVAAAFYVFVKLKPGESSGFRFGTNAPYARANTAAVDLLYGIYED